MNRSNGSTTSLFEYKSNFLFPLFRHGYDPNTYGAYSVTFAGWEDHMHEVLRQPLKIPASATKSVFVPVGKLPSAEDDADSDDSDSDDEVDLSVLIRRKRGSGDSPSTKRARLTKAPSKASDQSWTAREVIAPVKGGGYEYGYEALTKN